MRTAALLSASLLGQQGPTVQLEQYPIIMMAGVG